MAVLYRPLISLLTMILLTGFIVSPCCASLLSVASNATVSRVDSNHSDPDDIPTEFKDQYSGFSGLSSINQSMSECSISACVAEEELKRLQTITVTDILYIRSKLWLPQPPIDDLLKVPIAS